MQVCFLRENKLIYFVVNHKYFFCVLLLKRLLKYRKNIEDKRNVSEKFYFKCMLYQDSAHVYFLERTNGYCKISESIKYMLIVTTKTI
jgi:hypothetical protein